LTLEIENKTKVYA